MIDVFSEEVVSLTDAARLCPRRRSGKKPHVSCLYRWTTTGCKGVVLESIQIGGTRCTSHQALARFFKQLTAVAAAEPSLTCRSPAGEDYELPATADRIPQNQRRTMNR